jgi:O-antigen/teichoic acid export membrane protein
MNSHKSIFKGTFFTVSTRWFDRFVGFLSTIILARLLSPEDYGVVAIVTLSVGMARVFLDLGVHVALIQNKNVTQDHYNTAWTIKLIQSSLITFLLLIFSPIISDYFQDERSKLVLVFLSFIPFINSFQNIGLIKLQKEMKFKQEFYFLSMNRIFGFIVTILFAYTFRSYWALVIGSLSTAISGVFLSYCFNPMRPSFSINKFNEIFSVSNWMLLKNIGQYFQTNLHKIMVGHWSPSATLGAYSLGSDIAAMPTNELLAPFNRVLFPAFSNLQDDPVELKRVFLLAQGLQTLVAMPAAAGLALVANDLVPLLLGAKWVEAIPYIQILSWGGIFSALISTSGFLMISLGYLRLNVLFVYAQVIIFAILVFTFFNGSEAIIIAKTRLFVSMFGIVLAFSLAMHVFPRIQVIDLLKNTFRPILGVVAMCLTLFFLNNYLNLIPLYNIIIKTISGIIIYVVTVILLWKISKKPVGAESYLIDKFKSWYQVKF